MRNERLNPRNKIFLIMIAVSAMIFMHIPGFAALKHLTNAEKKQIIYGMYEGYKKAFPDVAEIDPRKAMQLMQTGQVVFVDDRSTEERKVSMLPGAITPEELIAGIQRYSNGTIVSYCTISYRSAKLTRKLRNQGLTAYNLAGGLLAWVLEGGKVYDGAGESKRIHVYGKRWNYPADGYQAVW